MTPRKTPRGSPAISYRDLMAGKGAPEPARDPGTEKPATASQSEAEKPATERQSGVQEPATEPLVAAGTLPLVHDVPKVEPPTLLLVHDVPTGEAPTPPVVHALPPARRRDRSRELTPRELAAVLNTEQAAAARILAEETAAVERAAQPEAEPEAIPTTTALNAPVIQEVGPRHSASISSDTMEFAVAAATATLPFRDRVRARAGLVDVLRFRIGTELFATDLSATEEVLERPSLHLVPEMLDQMLGVFSLRGKLIPVFSPAQVLGASLAGAFGAAIVLRGGDRRMALAIDDVDDVMTLDLARLREIPAGGDPEGVLLAVAWHGTQLVSLIDAEALLAACRSEQLVETA